MALMTPYVVSVDRRALRAVGSSRPATSSSTRPSRIVHCRAPGVVLVFSEEDRCAADLGMLGRAVMAVPTSESGQHTEAKVRRLLCHSRPRGSRGGARGGGGRRAAFDPHVRHVSLPAHGVHLGRDRRGAPVGSHERVRSPDRRDASDGRDTTPQRVHRGRVAARDRARRGERRAKTCLVGIGHSRTSRVSLDARRKGVVVVPFAAH